ncbi:hypothetical protein R1flu_026744 [Riccia fluitans]|uniref:Secreted protein n=1 Tax=Riccia fluitans TaxID=41844 RepID=A0ABD1XJU0_9MARC
MFLATVLPMLTFLPPSWLSHVLLGEFPCSGGCRSGIWGDEGLAAGMRDGGGSIPWKAVTGLPMILSGYEWWEPASPSGGPNYGVEGSTEPACPKR